MKLKKVIPTTKTANKSTSQSSTDARPSVLGSPAYLSTGSMLLNLALSDDITGGYSLGKLVNIVGDSSSGKSLLSLNAFAEANSNKAFDDYEFIYDDVENACEFDIEKLFGKKTANRIKSDYKSNTIQQFYGYILKLLADGKPFIYVLDSFDSLTTKEEQERAKAYEKAIRDNKELDEKGSYKVEKARYISEILRVIKERLKESNSLLIIISQTRQNIGVTFGFKKTRSGGDALHFYSTHEFWLAISGHEKDTKQATKDIEVGVEVMLSVRKNKLTGKRRKIEFTIYYDYGIDDIGSTVDWLLENQFIAKTKQTISIPGLDIEGVRDNVIKMLEEKEDSWAENIFKKFVQECWDKKEDSVKLNRKPRYE